MWTRTLLLLGVAVTLGAAPPVPGKVTSPRLYIFDCGVIKGLGVDRFGFKVGEVPVRDFFVPCYLVVHPKGTMMWDVGVVAGPWNEGTHGAASRFGTNRVCCVRARLHGSFMTVGRVERPYPSMSIENTSKPAFAR